jgi:hypothetical protein
MDIAHAHRTGRVAVAGGTLALLGAAVPFDVVFLLAASACFALAWVAWQLGHVLHAVPDPVRQAGGAMTCAGLTIAALGFLAAYVAALIDRADIVFASLSTAVSAGLYVIVPCGLVLLGIRLLRVPELGPLWRATPLIIGCCGVIAIPATVLISLPTFQPGQFATFLGILREIVLVGWIAIGAGLLRASAVDDA